MVLKEIRALFTALVSILRLVLSLSDRAVLVTTCLLGTALVWGLWSDTASALTAVAAAHFVAVTALLLSFLIAAAPINGLGDPLLYTKVDNALAQVDPKARTLLFKAMQADNNFQPAPPGRKTHASKDDGPPNRKFILPAENELPAKAPHWPTLFPKSERRRLRRAMFAAAGSVAKQLAPTNLVTIAGAIVSLAMAAFVILSVDAGAGVVNRVGVSAPSSMALVILDQITKGALLDTLEFFHANLLEYEIDYSAFSPTCFLFALRTLPAVVATTVVKHWLLQETLRDLIVDLTSEREGVVQLRWKTLDEGSSVPTP